MPCIYVDPVATFRVTDPEQECRLEICTHVQNDKTLLQMKRMKNKIIFIHFAPTKQIIIILDSEAMHLNYKEQCCSCEINRGTFLVHCSALLYVNSM